MIKSDPEYNRKNSVAWFTANVRQMMSGLGPMKLLGQNQHRQSDTPTIGKMMFFTYDPKTKDKLPYYDTFPLVIPFSSDKTSFTGINFHYLMPKTRLVLLNKLFETASDERMDDKTTLLVNWNLLKNASRYPEVQPAVKKYLFSHVKSRMVILPVSDFPVAVFLPVEKFRKKDASFVWDQSARRI
jgi:hypothetical protein